MALPIYQEDHSTYRADTCGPLEAAVSAGKLELQALVHGHYPGRRLPRAALPGVKTVGYWDARESQDWGLDWHRNEGIELTWLETGSVDFAVDRSSVHLRPDDLTITRPWQSHRVGDPRVGPGRLHWLILDVGMRRPHQAWRWPDWIVLTKDDLRDLTTCLRYNEQPVWHATAEFGHCFQRIGTAVQRDREGSNVSLLAALLNELLVHVLEMFRQRTVSLDESLTTGQRTVDLFWLDLREHADNLASEWTVELMAHRCGLGTTQFIHLTRRLFNMTPAHYLNVCRLKFAAEILTSDRAAPIAAVAAASGFNSSRYFATQFRQYFHCKPSEYRNRLVNNS